MSHLIDMSNSRANIAYIGEEPWHGLGQRLSVGAGIEVWRKEAGLEYEVLDAPVQFQRISDAGQPVIATFPERKVLYRSDTKGPLSVVSKDYRVVQPSTILNFFSDLVAHNGFELEVAGVLDDGRRVWALAKVNDGAPVIGHDIVRPYLLCATSYDGSMSTIAKFTAVRVVCHNTITMSVGGYDAESGARVGGEKDKTDGAVVQCVRVPHSAEFKPEEAKVDLGIVLTAYDRFLVESRLMAEQPVDDRFVIEFLKKLLPERKAADGTVQATEEGRAFKRLMAIWKGEIPSATLPEAKGTVWGLLNAVTWDVDHERGGDATRLNSAWFGSGEGLKNKARELLVEVVR